MRGEHGREKEGGRRAVCLWGLLLPGQRKSEVPLPAGGLETSGAPEVERVVDTGREELLDHGRCLLLRDAGTI